MDTRPRRLAWFPVFAAALTLVSAACASVQVGSYLERDTDLRQYHTYNWGPPDTASTGDPRLDNNRFFAERVTAQVDRQMATRGIAKTTSGMPDVLVHYHVRISQVVRDLHVDPQPTDCAAQACRPVATDEGMLYLDWVDTATNEVVWRGWVEENFDGVIENQAFMESRIDDAVSKIFKRLPPRR
jgi:hypothetical protein